MKNWCQQTAIRPALTENQIHELAGYAKEIEKHYGCYMDMEFALDARTDRLWLVQARPETVWSNKNNKQATKESTVSMNKTKNLGQRITSKSRRFHWKGTCNCGS